MTTSVQPDTRDTRQPETQSARQFVNFMFFHVDRAFRREPAQVRLDARREFTEIVQRYTGPMMILPYSTVGLKAGVDFMLWRIGYDIDPFQKMIAEIEKQYGEQ